MGVCQWSAKWSGNSPIVVVVVENQEKMTEALVYRQLER